MANQIDASTSRRLLRIFDENLCGEYSKPLMSKDHNVIISPPVLFPGETLILQQDKVTCVNTLSHRATGALHLTNYRIVFTGEYMQKEDPNLDFDFSKLGYYYQKRKKFFSNVSPNIRKLVGGNKSKSLRLLRKASKSPSKWTVNKLLVDEDGDENLDAGNETLLSDGQSSSLPSFKYNEISQIASLNVLGGNSVMISLPILSLHDIKTFSKQYLDNEKLMMLNDGIEILTTYFLSVKFCLGEEGSYDSNELISRLLKHSKVKSKASAFAYTHRSHLFLPKSCNILEDEQALNSFQAETEMERLDIGCSSDWKLIEQSICVHYPPNVIGPVIVRGDQDLLQTWANFHVDHCFPVIVWRCVYNRSLLLRSSSTTSCRGDKDWRCIVDENIIRSICSVDEDGSRKLCIFTDTPLQQSTLGNPSSCSQKNPIYYPNCEVNLLENLPDNTSSQQCIKRLQTVLNRLDDSQYFKSIEETGYFQELTILLDYALCVVAKLTKGSHVLLSVGSGRERVAQLSSLVQLLMDPFYRTFNGFQVLIQKEWCSLQYPFVKRNLIDFSSEEEISPLFLQFLDCVWQIMQQYPVVFQFSENLLSLLADHAYSGRFGTFINEKPEQINNNGDTIPIWPYINLLASTNQILLNYNYDDHETSQNTAQLRVLQPRVGIAHFSVWSWYNRYRRNNTLYVSSIFTMIEMEKLQKDYHEWLDHYHSLLEVLSRMDETSDCVAFNSRSNSSPSLNGESDEKSSYNSSGTYIDDEDVSLRSYCSPGGRWQSLNCLRNSDSDVSSEVYKHGRSSFFTASTNDDSSTLPRKIDNRKVQKSFSLLTYLMQHGVRADDVYELQISKLSCCGYLVKKGDNVKSWKRRWFVIDLQKKYVAYFSNPSSVKAKGAFNYSSIETVYADKAKENGKSFLVKTVGRTYHIKAPSEKAMRVWMICFSVANSDL